MRVKLLNAAGCSSAGGKVLHPKDGDRLRADAGDRGAISVSA
jgi:hypothetical protein